MNFFATVMLIIPAANVKIESMYSLVVFASNCRYRYCKTMAKQPSNARNNCSMWNRISRLVKPIDAKFLLCILKNSTLFASIVFQCLKRKSVYSLKWTTEYCIKYITYQSKYNFRLGNGNLKKWTTCRTRSRTFL